MNRHTLLYYIGAAVVVLLLTACKKQTVYNHYEHTPVAGWEKNDTLTFRIGPLKNSDEYIEEVGLRINGNYPFTGLDLIVEQKLLSTNKVADDIDPAFAAFSPSRSDTLTCSLIDNRGHAKGRGISHYQYLFHLTNLNMKKGDMLYVAIRHDMKREILPGISDIGIRLSQKSHKSSLRTRRD